MANSERFMNNEVKSFIPYFSVLFDNKFKILKFVLITMVIGVAISFIIPKEYTSTTVVLPDIDLLNTAQKFGNLQSLAASVGLNLGVTSPSELYPQILESETILKPVIYKKYRSVIYDSEINLIQFFRFDSDDSLLNYEQCLKILRDKIVNIDLDKKTGIIELSVQTTEPNLSADIANEMIYCLDQFQRDFRRTNASEQRIFIEQRLQEVQNDLARAEDTLRIFREKNRRIMDSPQLLLEEGRLGRDVELNNALFVELKKQNELVKLDEIKNTTVVQVLDKARPSAVKSSPKKLVILFVIMFLSTLLSSSWFILIIYLEKHFDKYQETILLNKIITSLKKFRIFQPVRK